MKNFAKLIIMLNPAFKCLQIFPPLKKQSEKLRQTDNYNQSRKQMY
jgi:hypothetical protein